MFYSCIFWGGRETEVVMVGYFSIHILF